MNSPSTTFNLGEYEAILQHMMDRGRPVHPVSAAPGTDFVGDDIFLRHDVDYSLHIALEMAHVNHSKGVRGCFCIQVRGNLYNPADEQNQKMIHAIKGLDQEIGLHFCLPDSIAENGPPAAEQVRELVVSDHKLLSEIAGVEVMPCFSWHNPSVLGEDFSELVHSPFEPLFNCNWLNANGVKYLSDANHRHSPEKWHREIEDTGGPIQALFHPFQWVVPADTMEETLGKTWGRIFRQYEETWMTNHIYRAKFPDGMAQEDIETIISTITGND